MARHQRLHTLNTMMKTGLVPVFYSPDLEVAKNVAGACAAGGCPILEFTNRGDHAWEVFTELERFCAKNHPELILGVGPGRLGKLRIELKGTTVDVLAVCEDGQLGRGEHALIIEMRGHTAVVVKLDSARPAVRN